MTCTSRLNDTLGPPLAFGCVDDTCDCCCCCCWAGVADDDGDDAGVFWDFVGIDVLAGATDADVDGFVEACAGADGEVVCWCEAAAVSVFLVAFGDLWFCTAIVLQNFKILYDFK